MRNVGFNSHNQSIPSISGIINFRLIKAIYLEILG